MCGKERCVYRIAKKGLYAELTRDVECFVKRVESDACFLATARVEARAISRNLHM